jgi:hypothetical protein
MTQRRSNDPRAGARTTGAHRQPAAGTVPQREQSDDDLRRLFDEVMDRYPDLAINGFGARTPVQFAVGRDELRRERERVLLVHKWIKANIRPVKTPNTPATG